MASSTTRLDSTGKVLMGMTLGVVLGVLVTMQTVASVDIPDPEVPPTITGCRLRQSIILDTKNSWPAGSVTGCKCLLVYEGRVYIDMEIRHPDDDLCTQDTN